MATFNCPTACAKLCSRPVSTDFIFQLSDLYGLTLSERALVAEMPYKSLQAFKLSHAAERICLERFPQSQTNDGSDACRHFVWAALMSDGLGEDLTQKFLNAHEDDPKQPALERAMDLANNRLGQLEAQALKKKNAFSKVELLKGFDRALKNKELVIIRPAATSTGEIP